MYSRFIMVVGEEVMMGRDDRASLDDEIADELKRAYDDEGDDSCEVAIYQLMSVSRLKVDFDVVTEEVK